MGKNRAKKKKQESSSSPVAGQLSTPSVRNLASLEKSLDSVRKLEKRLEKGTSGLESEQLELARLKVYCGAVEQKEELVAEGVELLKVLCNSDDTHGLAYLELAWTLSFYAGAEHFSMDPCFDKATQLLPEVSDAWKAKAIAHFRLGESEEGYRCLAQVDSLLLKEGFDANWENNFKQSSSLPIGGGFLFEPIPLGNLHYPPANMPSVHKFHGYILDKVLVWQPESQELLLEAALNHFFQGNIEQSIEYIDRLLKISPSNIDALSLRGFLWEKQGNTSEALSLYKQVLAIDSEHPFANTNMARFLQSVGSSHMAEKMLEKALQSAPEYPEALCLYGRSLSYKKEEESLERSLECHKKAIQLGGNIPDYHLFACLSLLQLGQIEKLQGEWTYHKKYIQAFTDKGAARKLINIAVSGAKNPLQEIAIAEMLNQNGFSLSAKVFVQRAWKRRYTLEKSGTENNVAEFYHYTGLQASHCGEHEISLEAYQELEKIEGVGRTASTCVALAFSQLGKDAEALDKVAQCTNVDSRMEVIQAGIYWRAGKPDKAIESHLQLLEGLSATSQAGNNSFLSMYHGVKYAIHSGNTDSLAKFLEIGLERWPQSSQMMALQGEVYLAQNNPEKAVDVLKDFLYREGKPVSVDIDERKRSIEDNAIEPYYVLGCALLQSGKQNELEELFIWLEHVYPYVAEWSVLKAEQLRQKGEIDLAVDILDTAEQIPPILYSKALCYRALEQESAYQKAIEDLPKKPDSKLYAHPEGSIWMLQHEALNTH